MKLALAQMSMTSDMQTNLEKSLAFCDEAKDCDLLFFPEIQLSPFFPQYAGRDATKWCLKEDASELQLLAAKAQEHDYYLSPNVYLEQNGKNYDASLWIDPEGKIQGISKMVHIANAQYFYEKDYYTPSDDGFKVFDTNFGKVGIVICFDRHLPESIRTCALMGADLILIPTANTMAEPMDLFEWEIRVQAMQNHVFIAMCNRTGLEDAMEFAGESLVVDPKGKVIVKADSREQLLTCELELYHRKCGQNTSYLELRRPEWYL